MKVFLGCVFVILIALGFDNEANAQYVQRGKLETVAIKGPFSQDFQCIGYTGKCFTHNGPSKEPTNGDVVILHFSSGDQEGKLVIYAENGDWDNTDEDESPIFSFEPLNPEDMQFEF